MRSQHRAILIEPPVLSPKSMAEPPYFLIVSGWCAWGLSVLLPLLFLAIVFLLWPILGLLIIGVYGCGLIVFGVSGSLNLYAFVCFTLSFLRRERKTQVIATVGLCLFLIVEVGALAWIVLVALASAS